MKDSSSVMLKSFTLNSSDEYDFFYMIPGFVYLYIKSVIYIYIYIYTFFSFGYPTTTHSAEVGVEGRARSG